MPNLTLSLLEGVYAIHRFPANANVPESVFTSPFYAVMRTKEELSLVVPETVKLQADRTESDWVCFKVEANLDLGLVGILAELANVLASVQVAIFALSSYNTDYFLVKKAKAEIAKQALVTAGYRILLTRTE